MVVKIYISGISGNKEVKKRQQRVLMILDSKSIKYECIDITEPGREADKEYMQSNSKSNGGTVSDPNPRSPLPPQMFNDDEYCGDYDLFDLANEVDTLEQFLKLEVPPEVPPPTETEKEKAVNGDVVENIESNEEIQETSAEDKPSENGETAVKESTPTKEESPAKEDTPLRDATPAGDANDTGADASAKGDSKEATPERQKSVDKEPSPEKAASPDKELESKKSKENTPEKDESVNENGTVSSRDTSQEKDDIDQTTIESKKDPSESLIQSEQTAAAE